MMQENSSITNKDLIPIPTIAEDNKKPTINGDKKKKPGSFNLLKAALLMLRRGSKGKPKPVQVEVASNGNWKQIVGSIRPLHLHDHLSPPSSIMEGPPSPIVEQFEDMIAPASPSPSSSSGGTMSQYASANNLQELDKDEESGDDDPDEVFDAIRGDEMIDSKADEFIAQFYQQMKLQNWDSGNRHIHMGA
ncbi:unnamed protein product [Ilex paraguariensis]|uniref:Uncharacterized protein n=1 Tax=Ilex paraguariensis TaxID=185542 RepID=A0ABC8UXI9_9AQUA